MLFNSWRFLLFFPLVTTLYFLLPRRFRWALLLGASCAFYMAFIPRYILILAFTIGVDYLAGLWIDKAEGARRKLFLCISLLSNVGILAFFKYFNFLNENLRVLAQAIHWNYPVQALAIILPIGLSFHIFQSMSYTIEVYRGNQKPERHFGLYALYVMFYPQLVAGPIERPQNLLHQFREEHPFDEQRVTRGLQRMLWGFFKKCVVADRLALVVNPVFDHPAHYTGLPLIAATFFFAFQIYCDFSGYSDIALGAAEVMGFRLMENFKRPYYSKSIREFWTRWHISLSTWFKDYLYIPLGGNRVSRVRWSLNLLIVFMVSGLWHGANWTYVVWGALHGSYLVFSLWTSAARARLAALLRLDRLPLRLVHAYQVAVTFSLVGLAWIFFRAANLPDAWYIVTHLFSGLGAQLSDADALAAAFAGTHLTRANFLSALLGIALLETAQLLQRRRSLRDWLARQGTFTRWSLYHAALLALVFGGVFDNQAFIYFQF